MPSRRARRKRCRIKICGKRSYVNINSTPEAPATQRSSLGRSSTHGEGHDSIEVAVGGKGAKWISEFECRGAFCVVAMEILFADESNAASYSLLALPKALYEEQLEIRGSSAQPATLVTSDATYSIQGTQHSNSLLLLLEPNQIQATLHETLTLVRNYPNFSGLLSLLHGTDYVGEEEDGGRREVTLDDLRDVLPASDSEIEAALVKNRVLDLDGRLRLLPNSFLLAILPKLLEGMDPPISLPSSKDESQAKGKRKAVAMEQKTGPILAKSSREATLDWFEQVDLSTVAGMKLLRWYGDVENQNWELRVEDIVRDIGVALLAAGGVSWS